jgi:hypothetical protein
MGKFFTASDHLCFLVSEFDFEPVKAEKIVQSEISDDFWELYAEMLNRAHATKKFFSRCFGEINLSDQGNYTAQHLHWFEKAETTNQVTYLKGRKCFFDHDIMLLSDGNNNNTVISTQSFLDCLADDRGLKYRVEALYHKDRDKLYKVLADFLGWHFEEIHWGYRDNA